MFSNICRHKYKCLAVTLYSKNNAGAYDAGGDAGVARDAEQRTKGEASSQGWGRKWFFRLNISNQHVPLTESQTYQGAGQYCIYVQCTIDIVHCTMYILMYKKFAYITFILRWKLGNGVFNRAVSKKRVYRKAKALHYFCDFTRLLRLLVICFGPLLAPWYFDALCYFGAHTKKSKSTGLAGYFML